MNDHPPTSPLPSVMDGLSFRFALGQVAKAVELVYRTADRLCCTDPAVSAHVRELADHMAAATLATFRQWPQTGSASDVVL